jgi:hypothetical protein
MCSRSDGGDDELDRLVQWIVSTGTQQQLLLGPPPSSSSNQQAVESHHQPPSTLACTPLHGQCRNRVSCSFRLLNDVRQACRPFIAEDVLQKTTAVTTSTTKRTAAVDQPAINLDSKTDFPALMSVTPTQKQSFTTTTTTKNPGPIPSVRSKKERNRIQPVIFHPSSAMPPVEGHSPWNNRSTTHAGTTNAGAVLPVDCGAPNKVVGKNLVNATPPGASVDIDDDEDVLADFVKLNQPPTTNKQVLQRREKTHYTVILQPHGRQHVAIGENPTQTGVVVDQSLPAPASAPTKASTVVNELSQAALSANVLLNNLAILYSILIDSCLVPSSLDEVHLLLTLLACNNDAVVVLNADDAEQEELGRIGPVLNSTERCRYFATQVLRRQSPLLVLIVPLVPQLLQCTILTEALPDLVAELEQSMERYTLQKSHERVRLSSQHNALLTLPFRPGTDSKHHYKSSQQALTYKNREDTRDAFLYQLRAFLNERGKMVDAKQSRSAMEKMKHSAYGIVSDVTESNMSWLAEFFTEMLVRLGNIPLQETDSDVLTIVDQEKLDALHRRFSTNTGSTKIAGGSKNDVSPYDAAQKYFTNHQEFFYLFVTSANCYTFTIQLRATLIRQVKEHLNQSPMNNLDVLCLLARFLGVLIFSPNWQQPTENGGAMMNTPPDVALDSLHLLGSCGLLLPDHLQQSKTPHNILFVIELLSMSKWDTRTVCSPIYLQSLQMLRNIQLQACRDRTSIVSLWIETFFGEFSDLSIASAVVVNDALSFVPEECSTLSWPHHLDSRVEELESLVDDICKSCIASRRLYGASRKLRPSAIGLVNATFPQPASVAENRAEPALAALITRKGDFLSKLGDSFFHQHAGLKSICEFSINQTFVYVEDNIEAECFSGIEQPETSGPEVLVRLHSAYSNRASEYLKSKLISHTRGVLRALCPSTDEFVIDEAISLTCHAGIASGTNMVNELVKRNVDKARAALLKLERRGGSDAPKEATKHEPCQEHVTALTAILSQIASLQEENSSDDQHCSAIVDGLTQVRAIALTATTLENRYTSDQALRSFYVSVCHFLDKLQSMGCTIEDSESKTSNDSLLAFMSGALIAAVLGSYSKKSMQVLREIFNKRSFVTRLFAKVSESSQLLSHYRNLVDELVTTAHVVRRQSILEAEQAVVTQAAGR